MMRLATMAALLAGCAQPLHLQPDFGRCYQEAFSMQADVTRPSVRGAIYPITGEEGLELREKMSRQLTGQEQGLQSYLGQGTSSD